MKRLDEKVRKAGAEIPDWLCLSDHTSKWNMDVYLAVDKEIPDAENTTISGTFLSKVYEGPYKDTGKWCNDFENTQKVRILISINGICGTLPVRNAQRNMERTT